MPIVSAKGQRHDARPRLDKPPGDEELLGQPRRRVEAFDQRGRPATVAGHHARIFAGYIEGIANFRRDHQPKGLVVEGVYAGQRAALIRPAVQAVECAEQLPAVLEPVERDALEREGTASLIAGPECLVRLPEKAGPRVVVRRVNHRRRQVDVGGHGGIRWAEHARDDRPKGRPIPRRLRALPGPTGQAHVASVIVGATHHAAQHRQAIGNFCQPRQVLAKVDARHAGGDGPEGATDIRGGLGLEVHQVDV